MSSTSFVYKTPMIRREQSASLTPPSPPSKKFCTRSANDMPFTPNDNLCLPLLDHFECEAAADVFVPRLAPRPSSTFSFKKANDENEEPTSLRSKNKRSASALALPPLSLEPRTNKHKRTLHALCA